MYGVTLRAVVDMLCSLDHAPSPGSQLEEIPSVISVEFVVYSLTRVERAGNKKKRVKVDQ